MAKDPAFLFYSSDFMTGTMFMTMEQKGQYICILCMMHQHGRLTIEQIETVLHTQCPDIILGKLKKDGEFYYNERLETEVSKRKAFSESRRNSLKIDNGDMVHLYLVFDPSSKLYKIGSSKYPDLRIKEVQKHKPESEFFWVSDSLFERINEKKLQYQYSEKRKRYDWFALSKEDLETIRTTFSKDVRTSQRTENENENENINDIDIKLIMVSGKKIADPLPILEFYEAQLNGMTRENGNIAWKPFVGAWLNDHLGEEFTDGQHVKNSFKRFYLNQKPNGKPKKESLTAEQILDKIKK